MFNNKVYHKIDALSGSIATLRAEGVKYGEVAEVESRAGTSLAQVIKLDGPNVTLQIFAGARGVDTAAKVRFLGETMKIPFSKDLLGRAFTGAGVPRDGGPAITENPSPIGQPSVNPAKRIMPHRMVKTNIPMIDLFNSLVVSQKLPIITIIMNNQVLGMVYQWQDVFYNGRHAATDPGRQTNFPAVAEGFGALGLSANTPDEFSEAFAKALKETDRPVWIDCHIAKDEFVLPMIPAGGTVEDMIIG